MQQASHKDSETKRNAKTKKNNKNELTTIRQKKIVFFFPPLLRSDPLLACSITAFSSAALRFFPLSFVAFFPLRRRSPSCFRSSFSSLTLSPSFVFSIDLSPSSRSSFLHRSSSAALLRQFFQ
jgi:hypothetical protein